MTVVRIVDGKRKKKPMDENEKLVAGILPEDPAEGCAVVRTEVVVGADLSRVVDDTIRALGPHKIFQRQGTLVDVVRDGKTGADGITRPTGTPRIRMLPIARLKEFLTFGIDFKRRRMVENEMGETKISMVSVAPPDDVVKAVEARGEWSHIRPLAGIAEWPAMRPDGTFLSSPGYDPQTTLIYEPNIQIDIPEAPTLDDAKAAIGKLYGLVSDFPFEKPVYRSAWLAGLLTLFARPAIEGPTPLVLIDANMRGSGKSLLADVAGVIVRGKPLPRRTAPEDAAEWKKALLGIAIAGDPVVLIDNVTRMLKSDALDAVLTGTSFQERVLGKNKDLVLDIRTLFVVTSNNAQLSVDLVRRSLYVRLEATTENPEQRSNFAHKNLLEHVKEKRAEYVVAVVTILRAWVVAGRPEAELRTMGSYEAWSSIVRSALVWAGELDPAVTQDELRAGADVETETVGSLLPAWFAVYGEKSVTVRSVLADLDLSLEEVRRGDTLPPNEAALKDAIGVLCDCEASKLPSSRKLANTIRKLRGRICNGYVLHRTGDGHHDGYAWCVQQVGGSGDLGGSPTASLRARAGEVGSTYTDPQTSPDPQEEGLEE